MRVIVGSGQFSCIILTFACEFFQLREFTPRPIPNTVSGKLLRGGLALHANVMLNGGSYTDWTPDGTNKGKRRLLPGQKLVRFQ